MRTLLAIVIVALAPIGCRSGPLNSKEQYLARGNVYASQRKYREAIVDYLNAVRLDPKFGPAHERLADAYFRNDDARLALREYVTAADLMTTDVDAQLNAAQALLMAGAYQDAQGRAEKALGIDPTNASGQLIRANALAGQKQMAAAIEALQQLVATNPNDADAYTTLGGLHASAGHDTEAEAAFKRAVEVAPKSPVALVALANFYRSKGRRQDAESTLKHAAGVAPADPRVQNALAAFYLSTGRDKDAEAPLRAVDASTKSAAAQMSLADYYLRMHREGDAIKLLKELAAGVGFAPATLRLAQIDYERQRIAQAHREVDAVAAKDPKNADALMLKATFLRAEHKPDEALASTNAAASVDHVSGEPEYFAGLLHADRHDVDQAIASMRQAIAINPKHIQAKLALAGLELERGRAATSVQLTREVLTASPQDLKAQLMLARGLLASGDAVHAEETLRMLAATESDNPEVHTLLGRVELAKKNTPAAAREFDRAMQIDPTNVEARQLRLVLDAGHARSTAIGAIAVALEKSPNDAHLLAQLASAYAAQGDVANEEKTLRTLIALDPKDLEAFGALAGLYMRTGRLDEARKGFETIVRTHPRDAVAQTMLGEVLQAQQNTAQAQKAYEAVVANPLDAPIAANNLAWLYAENGGNLDVALQLARAAKQQLANSSQVDDTLGWVYYKKNLPELAVPSFEESVKRDPRNAAHVFHLGLAYLKSGNITRARESFAAAIRLKPDFREAAQRLAELR